MIKHINGFNLEVTEREGLPHVRVSLSGKVVVDTDAVSIEGLRRLAAVFEAAADMAFRELERYYAREHEAILREKSKRAVDE
jgi:hypothetical protein